MGLFSLAVYLALSDSLSLSYLPGILITELWDGMGYDVAQARSCISLRSAKHHRARSRPIARPPHAAPPVVENRQFCAMPRLGGNCVMEVSVVILLELGLVSSGMM